MVGCIAAGSFVVGGGSGGVRVHFGGAVGMGVRRVIWRRFGTVVLLVVLVMMVVGSGVGLGVGAVGAVLRFPRVSVAPGSHLDSYSISWSAGVALVGEVFDVEVRYGTGVWQGLVTGTRVTSETFVPVAAGPYFVRARLRTSSGASSMWSPSVMLSPDWPAFHRDALRSGVVSDPTIGAGVAAHFGVRWKAPAVAAGAVFESSPVVGFNARRHEPIVYSATAGTVVARVLATGSMVWSSANHGPIVASPVLFANTLYVGTKAGVLVAFDATTGATECEFSVGGVIYSSPIVGSVDGSGPVVFFGDSGASEARNGGHEWAVNGFANSGGSCTKRWSFNGWNNTIGGRTGSWSPPALVDDSGGRPLVVFGSSDPDDSVYALDARDGTVVWRFQTTILQADQDVGAAPTIERAGRQRLRRRCRLHRR